MRKGFTLLECMLAGSLLCLMAVAFLKGIGVTSRVAHENAQMLAADGIVWDAVWKKFNEDYDSLRVKTAADEEELPASAAPELYVEGYPPILSVRVSAVRGYPDLREISADLEWGVPVSGRRRQYRHSDYQPAFVYRSPLGRVSW